MSQDDLFGKKKTVRERLEALWDLCSAGIRNTRDFVERAVDADVWDDSESTLRELKIQAHMEEGRKFVHERTAKTGRKRAVKTDKTGGIIPWQLALFEHVAFDIQLDCQQVGADRERIRQDIRACLGDHQQRPDVPEWIWGPEDDRAWDERAA